MEKMNAAEEMMLTETQLILWILVALDKMCWDWSFWISDESHKTGLLK